MDDTFYHSVGLHRITTPRLSTVYRHSGRDWLDAESVFLIHGSLSSGRWWESAMAAFEELMPNKYACYAPDLRSHGGADPRPVLGLESFADDVLAVMDSIGVKQAHIVGWSMGGGVATLLALDHPERCLSLTLVSSLSPVGMGRLTLPGNPDVMAQAIRRGEFETVAKLIRATNLREGRFPLDGSPPSNALFYYLLQSVMEVQNYPGDEQNGEGNNAAIYRYNVSARTSNLSVPVLSLHGDRDALAPNEYFAEARRYWPPYLFQEVIFEGSGHSPMIEQPRRFVITLDEFFAQV